MLLVFHNQEVYESSCSSANFIFSTLPILYNHCVPCFQEPKPYLNKLSSCSFVNNFRVPALISTFSLSLSTCFSSAYVYLNGICNSFSCSKREVNKTVLKVPRLEQKVNLFFSCFMIFLNFFSGGCSLWMKIV